MSQLVPLVREFLMLSESELSEDPPTQPPAATSAPAIVRSALKRRIAEPMATAAESVGEVVAEARSAISTQVRSLSNRLEQARMDRQTRKAEKEARRTADRERRTQAEQQRTARKHQEDEQRRRQKVTEDALRETKKLREEQARASRLLIPPVAKLHQHIIQAELAFASAVNRPEDRAALQEAHEKLDQLTAALNRDRAMLPSDISGSFDTVVEEFLSMLKILGSGLGSRRQTDKLASVRSSLEVTVPLYRQQVELDIQRLQERASRNRR